MTGERLSWIYIFGMNTIFCIYSYFFVCKLIVEHWSMYAIAMILYATKRCQTKKILWIGLNLCPERHIEKYFGGDVKLESVTSM